MRREGLTVTMIFLAESANYGEGVGNITTLKKLSRGNYEQYSYISRQALRYNIVSQLSWDNTPVDEKSGVVQFAPSATIKEYPEIDLFGYMKTTKEGDQKGGAATRSAVARLSNAVALEPYQSDMEFLTNMGLAKRKNVGNAIAQSEIQRSLYSYTLSIDLDRVGKDGELEITEEKKRTEWTGFWMRFIIFTGISKEEGKTCLPFLSSEEDMKERTHSLKIGLGWMKTA